MQNLDNNIENIENLEIQIDAENNNQEEQLEFRAFKNNLPIYT